MQDDPERGECFQHKMILKRRQPGEGTLRVNANHHGACSTSHAGRDARIRGLQRQPQLYRRRAQGDLRSCRMHLAGARVLAASEEKQRRRAALFGQDQRAQLGADHAADPALPPKRGRQPAAPRRHRFPRRYTQDDIALLATVDAAHEGLSGPALRRILWREYHVYGKAAYRRLASLSASHIYNLRRTAAYRQHHVHHTRTRSRAVAIGERRRPNPCGRPGYLRVDTVHQGDTDTRPGLYHINAVDTVTQWQVVGCCQTISEAHLLPVLEAILHQFPFRIRGFHSDNGSEFLNLRVAKLLHKLLIAEFTKSRAHRTTDNALVEGKNGAVVRKHIGHEPIAAEHAAEFQRFYTAWFNPYLNFHRPCGFATVEVSEQGKRRRHYRLEDYRTPYEKLVSLDEWEQHLKPGITADFLEQQTQRMSDTECARNMQQRKRKLLAQCRSRW